MIGVLRAVRADDDRADGVPERPQPTLVDLPMLIDESRKAGTRVVLECKGADGGGRDVAYTVTGTASANHSLWVIITAWLILLSGWLGWMRWSG